MTVDFSALTDLINATISILAAFVANSSTLVAFVVLMITLGLIGIIAYGFVGKFLTNMGSELGSWKHHKK